MYRFLHLVFSKGGKIDLDRLLKYMDVESAQCQRLIAFYDSYSKVHKEQVLYTTDEAFEERAKWCVFLNESKIFKFKKLEKYEVCATFENLIAFFRTFFPKIEIPDKSAGKQLQIDALCKALSFSLTLTANIREVIKPDLYG